MKWTLFYVPHGCVAGGGKEEEEEVSFKGGQWVSAYDAWQFGAAFLKGV